MNNLNNGFTYNNTTTTVSGGQFKTVFIVSLVSGIIVYLIISYILSRVFRKAGIKRWHAYIPILNNWQMLEMGGQSGAIALLTFIPFIDTLVFFVYYVIASIEIAKRFGKSKIFGVVGLVIFSIIGYTILAFDKSKYSYKNDNFASTSGPVLNNPIVSASGQPDSALPSNNDLNLSPSAPSYSVPPASPAQNNTILPSNNDLNLSPSAPSYSVPPASPAQNDTTQSVNQNVINPSITPNPDNFSESDSPKE